MQPSLQTSPTAWAEFVYVPVVGGRTTIVYVELALPGGSAPTAQLTTVVPWQPGLALTAVRPAGSWSESVTDEIVVVTSVLLAATEYVSATLGVPVAGACVFVTKPGKNETRRPETAGPDAARPAHSSARPHRICTLRLIRRHLRRRTELTPREG